MQLLSVLALLAAVPAALAQTYITSCGGTFNLTKFMVTPANPQAGDTVVLNSTGIETGSAPLTGGAGVIDAYLFGIEAFTAPFTVRGHHPLSLSLLSHTLPPPLSLADLQPDCD